MSLTDENIFTETGLDHWSEKMSFMDKYRGSNCFQDNACVQLL